MLKGIDISQHQKSIDFKLVEQSGIQFAILREGYRTTADHWFFEYVNQIKKTSIPIHGVYHFCYSINTEEVINEAKSCINNIQKAGLNKDDIIVFFDFEYDTVDKAKKRGVSLGKKECISFTKTFCDYIKSQGYKAGVYANLDYYYNYYTPELLNEYYFWLAEYNTNINPSIDCLYKQFTSDGIIDGIDTHVDMNYCYDNVAANPKQQIPFVEEKYDVTASDIINVMEGWIGKSRSAGTHHDIIDLYNSYTPRARGYAVTYSDDYCDTTVSAAFIKLNAVNLIGGTECGVQEHVKLFQKAGIWQEDGTVTPAPGWIIVYSWRTNKQPNNSYSDHIGIVKQVNGNTITCVEGNISGGVVGYRYIQIANGNIRGYAIPKYGKESSTKPSLAPIETSTAEIEDLLVAKSKTKFTISEKINPSKKPLFVGQVTANLLYVRSWAGVENNPIKSWPMLAQGNLIDVCDSIQDSKGNTWYYIRIAERYYGFSMAKYIKKV